MLEPHIVVSITQFQLLNDLPNRIPPSPFRLIKYQFVEDLFFVKSPMKPSIPKNWRDNLQHILFSMARNHGFPELPLKPTCSFPPWWWPGASFTSVRELCGLQQRNRAGDRAKFHGAPGDGLFWGGAWRIPFWFAEIGIHNSDVDFPKITWCSNVDFFLVMTFQNFK